MEKPDPGGRVHKGGTRGHRSLGASQRGNLPPALASSSCALTSCEGCLPTSSLLTPAPALLCPGHTQGHCYGCCSQGQPWLRGTEYQAPGRAHPFLGPYGPPHPPASAFPLSLPFLHSLPSPPPFCLPTPIGVYLAVNTSHPCSVPCPPPLLHSPSLLSPTLSSSGP